MSATSTLRTAIFACLVAACSSASVPSTGAYSLTFVVENSPTDDDPGVTLVPATERDRLWLRFVREHDMSQQANIDTAAQYDLVIDFPERTVVFHAAFVRPPATGTPSDVRGIEEFLGSEAARAIGRDIFVSSGYRTDSAAHARGAIDVLGGPSHIARVEEATEISRALKGQGITVILEEVLSDGFQVNSYFHDGKRTGLVAGQRGSHPDLHATGTHIHIQPPRGFAVPAPPIVDIQYPNGDSYHGPMVSGKRQGEGVYHYRDGTEYRGLFDTDLPNGPGRYTTPQGFSYTGDFKDGKKQGKGTSVAPDGTTFAGQYDNDSPVHGVCVYPDGDSFEGDVKGGKRSGHGVYSSRNGNRVDGNFVGDQLEGAATVFFGSGERYVGTFVHGIPTGPGTYTGTDGRSASCMFRDGRLQGAGSGDRGPGDLGKRPGFEGHGVVGGGESHSLGDDRPTMAPGRGLP
jgi:hypothetical protein